MSLSSKCNDFVHAITMILAMGIPAAQGIWCPSAGLHGVHLNHAWLLSRDRQPWQVPAEFVLSPCICEGPAGGERGGGALA